MSNTNNGSSSSEEFLLSANLSAAEESPTLYTLPTPKLKSILDSYKMADQYTPVRIGDKTHIVSELLDEYNWREYK